MRKILLDLLKIETLVESHNLLEGTSSGIYTLSSMFLGTSKARFEALLGLII